MKLEEFYDFLFDKARLIIESGTEHANMLFTLFNSGNIEVMMLAVPKEQQAVLMQTLLRDTKVRAVVQVCEAYQASPSKEEGEKIMRTGISPSLKNYPGRIEVLMFNFMTPDRQAVMTCPIHRPANTVDKVPFKWVSPHAETRGWFANPQHRKVRK
jgi:hypothetical protein